MFNRGIIDKFGKCIYCKTDVEVWHGHDVNCPWQKLDFIDAHVCLQSVAGGRILCIPCMEYGSIINAVEGDNVLSAVTSWDKDARYHTAFCREYRANFESGTTIVETELPKIKKAPRLESES